MVDKKALIKKLEEMATADLAMITQAALAAHQAATHAESKAEDQYDTRGLEASYLAGAQSKRAMELEELVNLFRHIDITTFTCETSIASTALVELGHEGKSLFYLLMPKGGGMSLTFADKLIQVVTPLAPMGRALLGKRVGDEFEVSIQKAARDYEVLGVW